MAQGIMDLIFNHDRHPTPRDAFKAYGHAANWEDRIAERKTDSWFAVLFRDHDELYAVDFQYDGTGWWLSNDYIGPFDSVRQFKTESLSQSLM